MLDKVCVRIGGRTIAEIDSCNIFDSVLKEIINEISRSKVSEGEVVSIEGEQFVVEFLSEDFFQCYGTGRKIGAIFRIFDELKEETNEREKIQDDGGSRCC